MEETNTALYQLVRELYPLARSITGDGVRETLRQVAAISPVTLHEVPTGTPVLDWEVPPEWNLRRAWIEDPEGRRIVDSALHNLHVVGYSVPVDLELPLEELQTHLHSDPARPEWIPYRTSYYARNWGFCLSHRQRLELRPGRYRVVIEATLQSGALSYAEAVIPGRTDDVGIVYTHTCHPSLANDNLSGIAVCAYLARWLASSPRRLTWRVIFGPGTIGSITWLARNRELLGRVEGGLVVGLVGIPAPLVYKRSWSGCAAIDRIADTWMSRERPDSRRIDFSPWGYDERQFGSPGFRLPVGRLTRAEEEGYPEYHSSGDNLDLVRSDVLADSLASCQTILGMLDDNFRLHNRSPFGEPQLGRRGLYRALGGPASPDLQRALLWLLSFGDGEHDLVDVYRRSGLPFAVLKEAASLLRGVELLA